MSNQPDGPMADPPLDLSTRLAFENTYLAQERTQMSWVQVCLALISFGFTIAKAFETLHEYRGTTAPLLGGRTVGMLMIVLGLVSLTLASVQHRRAMKAMRKQCPTLPMSQAGVLALLLTALGMVALISAFLRH
ncbi:MAG: DUF202 domain-containing protein [Gemmataceae bacterium]